MYERNGNYLIVAILIGMILGVITVAIFGEDALPVKFLGDIFLNALKMIVIPLLFCSMIVGISKLGDVRKLGRTGLKTILYFVATSSVAVAIGLILVNIIQPGSGFDTFQASVPETVVGGESYSFFSWLTSQIPSNIIGAAAETKVLPVIIFALFFGGVLTTIGAKGKPVISLFEGLNEAIMKIVHIIMWFAPIGIFGLVAGQLAAHGGMSGFSGVLAALGKYSLVVILGLIIHGVIILVLVLKFMGGKNPIEYFVGMSQALMTAFATASSSATLPVTMDCVEEKNDVDKRSSSFVLPLGATINMDGTALYEAVAAMFIAQAYGIDLPILSQIVVFATAVLASVGAAGIPEAGLVTMVLVLQAVGLPLEGIGLILAIDWFLDRCRTTVNVWGDSIGAAVIATTSDIGLVDHRRLKAVKVGRTPRARSFTRRKDTRGRRKGQEPVAVPTRERISAKGRKGNGSSKITTRRGTKPTWKTDRFGDKRTSRKDLRAVSRPQTERKEEYKPLDEVSKEKPRRTKPAKPNRIAKSDNKSTVGRNQTKTAFGRKRVRPTDTRTKPEELDIKQAGSDTVKAEAPDLTPEKKRQSGFEVPKFPDTILDDLVSAEREGETVTQDADGGEAAKVRENGSESRDPIIGAEEHTQPGHSADRDAMPEGNESSSVTGGPPAEEKPDEDFSRLDKAILGSSSESESHSGGASSDDDESSSGFPERESSFKLPAIDLPSAVDSESTETIPTTPIDDQILADRDDREEETSASPEQQEAIAPEVIPEIPETDSADEPDREESPAGDEIVPAESSVAPGEELSAADKAKSSKEEASESGEPSDSPASDDDESDNDSMKWGRHKRKKMSR